MSRLYDIKLDETKWDVTELDNKNYHSYKLKDKTTRDLYFFNYIIGAEEIRPNEFLVYDRTSRDNFRIRRLLAVNSILKKVFEKEFSKFDFITDDRILFSYYDNAGRYRSSGVYSIESNNYVEEANWLNYLPVEVFKLKKNPNEKGIFIEDEINSIEFNYPKLMYTVDPYTLEPNSDLYDEHRNVTIPVNSKEDIIKYKEEETKYLYELEEEKRKEKYNNLKQAKARILNK